MLCCFDTPNSYTPSGTESSNSGVSSFPGARRFTKTGGNALAAYDPIKHENNHQANHGQGFHQPQQQIGANGKQNESNRVSVTIPQGVSPGQTIHVVTPDGTGRTVAAVVPSGMSPGQSFIVEIPCENTVHQPAQAPNLYGEVKPVMPPSQSTATQSASAIPPPQSTSKPNEQTRDQCFINVTVPPGVPPGASLYVQVPGEEGRTVKAVVPPGVKEFQVPYEPAHNSNSSMPTATAVPIPAPSSALPSAPPLTLETAPSPTFHSNPMQGQKPGQSLVLVRVPPGTLPGSTLQIEIPGENRRIAAVVPPNVTEFHVAYDPTPAPIEEKRVLVKVPPGTLPGTTLHVQVPGENRIIAATVPPGVSEFQVTYNPNT